MRLERIPPEALVVLRPHGRLALILQELQRARDQLLRSAS